MKKILIFTSLFVAWIYLSSAINITLNSGQKLEGSSWNDLSSVLNKVDIDNNDLKINWWIKVNWKICDADNNCLGECKDWKIWDSSTSSCVLPATIPWTAPSWSTCKSILAEHTEFQDQDWYYFIKPTWLTQEVKAWCDMTTDWWWWTRWFDTTSKTIHRDYANNCINDGYYEANDFFCIKPEVFWSNIYMVQRLTQKVYYNVVAKKFQDYYSDWLFSWRQIGPPNTSGCREYNKNGYSINLTYFNGTPMHSMDEVECYIR
jgi:hypothetical protein